MKKPFKEVIKLSKICILSVATNLTFTSMDYTVKAIPATCGFQRIMTATGVKVYYKNRQSSKKEYVTVIQSTKAKIENLTGTVFSIPASRVSKKLLTEFWQDAVKSNTSTRKARVVINGTFFSTKQDPTGIAFGLKARGKIITYGYGIANEYPGEIRTFSFNPSTGIASIQPYNTESFRRFPEVIGVLDANANKAATKYLPRTFVGVRDDNGDNLNETVIFYSSNHARQLDASNALKCFGANTSAMLDGGGSTGIIVDGEPLIDTPRKIPHAIAIYGGIKSKLSTRAK
ncbi:MAG: phosphodiester glycosidase family protein [Richelia sp. RM2_1_2]|nr:phosphodiester glycosidase family protein [Richelia sp. SM1_7_0]NJO29695.1 phosphodiester glycosidase family protein [Richelia sp. SL_2_1]NJO62064.1 phosphodiester glycosidase family protein [Richelia sp. RM2_1_2]